MNYDIAAAVVALAFVSFMALGAYLSYLRMKHQVDTLLKDRADD